MLHTSLFQKLLASERNIMSRAFHIDGRTWPRIENVQPLFGTDGMPTGDGVIIPEPIPEPSTILLLVTGLTCIGAYGFRRRKKA